MLGGDARPYRHLDRVQFAQDSERHRFRAPERRRVAATRERLGRVAMLRRCRTKRFSRRWPSTRDAFATRRRRRRPRRRKSSSTASRPSAGASWSATTRTTRRTRARDAGAGLYAGVLPQFCGRGRLAVGLRPHQGADVGPANTGCHPRTTRGTSRAGRRGGRARAIGQAVDRLLPQKRKSLASGVRSASGIVPPSSSSEQRRYSIGSSSGGGPFSNSAAASGTAGGGWPFVNAPGRSCRRGLALRVSCQVEARELADDGVAADADVGGDLAAGKAGVETAFQEFDAFGSPGRLFGRRLAVPDSMVRRASKIPVGRLAVVADRKQLVLDGEPNAFLDQSPGDAGDACAVGALSHQSFEVGDGRERQRDGNTVGLAFSVAMGKR